MFSGIYFLIFNPQESACIVHLPTATVSYNMQLNLLKIFANMYLHKK